MVHGGKIDDNIQNALVVVGGKVSVGCSVLAEAFLVPLPPPRSPAVKPKPNKGKQSRKVLLLIQQILLQRSGSWMDRTVHF